MSNINPETVHGGTFTQEDSDRLHFLKNAPSVREINGVPISFPPYAYQPFPAAMYHTWTDARKRNALIEVARLNQLDLTRTLEREKAESMLMPWDTRLVYNSSEQAAAAGDGWVNDPADIKKGEQAYLDRIAEQAAIRAHDDLRLSEKARAEFDAADRANGEDHLLELPVPRLDKKRGRPSNAELAARAASA